MSKLEENCKVANPIFMSVLLKEYEIEKNKKASAEIRAGFMITILCALSLFIFEKISLKYLLYLMYQNLNIITLLEIVLGFLVYVGFVIALIASIKVIAIKTIANLEIKWDKTKLYESDKAVSEYFIKAYMQIVLDNRRLNDRKASSLKTAYLSVSVTVVLLILFTIF